MFCTEYFLEGYVDYILHVIYVLYGSVIYIFVFLYVPKYILVHAKRWLQLVVWLAIINGINYIKLRHN